MLVCPYQSQATYEVNDTSFYNIFEKNTNECVRTSSFKAEDTSNMSIVAIEKAIELINAPDKKQEDIDLKTQTIVFYNYILHDHYYGKRHGLLSNTPYGQAITEIMNFYKQYG